MAHVIITDNIYIPRKNEDHVISGYSEEGDIAIAVLADGVSSSIESKEGALASSKSIFENIKKGVQGRNILEYDEYYNIAFNVLKQNSESYLSLNEKLPQSLFATTTITAVISADKAEFSFVGNGAIFQIRKHWFDLFEDNLMLLGICNFLNSHIKLRNASTPLYKYLNAGIGAEPVTPEVLIIRSPEIQESYFLVCSDGLHTNESFTSFVDSNTGDYYKKENTVLILFLEMLRKYTNSIKSNPDDFKNEFRKSMELKGLLVDDLSYALFIPEF